MMVRKNYDPTLPPHPSKLPRRFIPFHHPLSFYSHAETHGSPGRIVITVHVSYELSLCHLYTACGPIVFPTDNCSFHVCMSIRAAGTQAHIMPYNHRSPPFTLRYLVLHSVPASSFGAVDCYSIKFISAHRPSMCTIPKAFRPPEHPFDWIVATPLIGSLGSRLASRTTTNVLPTGPI